MVLDETDANPRPIDAPAGSTIDAPGQPVDAPSAALLPLLLTEVVLAPSALETGFEQQTGAGNGLTGDDETSENTAMTWDTTFTLPTPGTVPTGLLP